MSAKRTSIALSLKLDSVYPGAVGEAKERVSRGGFASSSSSGPFVIGKESVTSLKRGLGGKTVGESLEWVPGMRLGDFSTQGSFAEGRESDTTR